MDTRGRAPWCPRSTDRGDPVNRFTLVVVTLAATAVLCSDIGAQGQIPDGFTRIFNGKDTSGWHISRTTHHGATGSYTVKDAVLFMQQKPFGQGGLLMTDKSYKDFDLYVELNPDAGFNSGIFLRSTESGSAYQIEVVAPGAATGDLIGEGIRFSRPQYSGEKKPVMSVWKTG